MPPWQWPSSGDLWWLIIGDCTIVLSRSIQIYPVWGLSLWHNGAPRKKTVKKLEINYIIFSSTEALQELPPSAFRVLRHRQWRAKGQKICTLAACGVHGIDICSGFHTDRRIRQEECPRTTLRQLVEGFGLFRRLPSVFCMGPGTSGCTVGVCHEAKLVLCSTQWHGRLIQIAQDISVHDDGTRIFSQARTFVKSLFLGPKVQIATIFRQRLWYMTSPPGKLVPIPAMDLKSWWTPLTTWGNSLKLDIADIAMAQGWFLQSVGTIQREPGLAKPTTIRNKNSCHAQEHWCYSCAPYLDLSGSRLEDLTPNKLLRSNCLLPTALREGQQFPEWRIWHLSAFSIDHLTLGTKTARHNGHNTLTPSFPREPVDIWRYVVILFMLKCVELLTQNFTQCSRPRQVCIIGVDPLMISHGLWKLAIWIGEMMINHQFWGSLFKILCHSVIVVAQRGFPYWLMIIHNILRTRASRHNQSTSFISYISIFLMLETIETPKKDGQVMWNQVKSRFVDEFPYT